MTLGYWPWMAAALIAAAALAIACNTTGTAKPIPVIKMDDEHLQLEREGPPPPMYTLPPTTEFILDAEGYELPYPEALAGKEVNSIQIVLGDAGTFEMPWQHGVKKYRIAKDTLRPQTSKSFDGFREGQRVVIGVGVMDPEERDFGVVWVGMANVRAP